MDKKTRILKELQRKEHVYTAFLAQQVARDPTFKPFKNRDEISAFLQKQGNGIIPLHVLLDGWEAHDYLQYFPVSELPAPEKISEKPEERTDEQHALHAVHDETNEAEEQNKPEKGKPVNTAPTEEISNPIEPAQQENTSPETATSPIQTSTEEASLPVEAMTIKELIQAHQEEVAKKTTAKPDQTATSTASTPKSAFEKIQDQQKRKDAISLSKMTSEQLKTAQSPQPLAGGMELDTRFKTIMANIMRTTGFDINGLYIAGKNGEEFLNPRLSSATREQARMLFIKRHPREAKQYAEKEKTRIYPEEAYRQDPAVINMDEETARVVKEEQRKLFAENPTVVTTSKEADTLRAKAEKATEPITEQFVRDFPEKARAYAKHDQAIAAALQRVALQKTQSDSTNQAKNETALDTDTNKSTTQTKEPGKTEIHSSAEIPAGPFLTETQAEILSPQTIKPITQAPTPDTFSQQQEELHSDTTGNVQGKNVSHPVNKNHQNHSPHISHEHPASSQQKKQKNAPSSKSSSQPEANSTQSEGKTTAPRLKKRWFYVKKIARERNENHADFVPSIASFPENRKSVLPPGGRRGIPQRPRRNARSPLSPAKNAVKLVTDPKKKLWLILFIVIMIVLLLVGFFTIMDMILGGSGTGTSSQTASSTGTTSPIPNLTIKKTSSDPACATAASDTYCIKNSDDAHYTISVTYSGSQDVVVTDTIPTGDGEITDYNPQNATTASATATATAPASSSSACTFSRAGESAPYSSPKLISYFNEVAQKTGVPASLLAALVRIESTTKDYSISTYTDDELSKMDGGTFAASNVDATSDGTNKALCPRSMVGAIGITQLQPNQKVHDLEQQELAKLYPGKKQVDPLYDPANEENNRHAQIKSFKDVGAYDSTATSIGAGFVGKNADDLTIQDYCDPKTSLYLAAGFLLGKLHESGAGNGKSYGNGKSWDAAWNTNHEVINQIATRYYGSLTYGSFSYGDDLYTGLNSCTNLSAGTSSGTTGSTTSGPAVTATKNSISWHVKSFGSGPTYTLSLTVHPLKSDFNLQNKAIATAGDNGSASGGGTGAIDQSTLQSGDFDKILTGQGRNTTILGDENNFVSTVIKNGVGFGLAGKEAQLRQVYEAAAALQVNPLAVLVIWGTETGFTGDARAFSCPVGISTSFSLQVACSAQTLNHWMSKFEQEKKSDGTLNIDKVNQNGQPIGGTCTYSDPLLYALEWYGPVCHSYDHNEGWHNDFLNKFKKFLGA